jgi:sulfur carrier protein
MKIKLNGSEKEFDKEFTVEELITNLDLQDRRVAVLLNNEIVKKEDRPHTFIKNGDIVEIVQMVGGG